MSERFENYNSDEPKDKFTRDEVNRNRKAGDYNLQQSVQSLDERIGMHITNAMVDIHRDMKKKMREVFIDGIIVGAILSAFIGPIINWLFFT